MCRNPRDPQRAVSSHSAALAWRLSSGTYSTCCLHHQQRCWGCPQSQRTWEAWLEKGLWCHLEVAHEQLRSQSVPGLLALARLWALRTPAAATLGVTLRPQPRPPTAPHPLLCSCLSLFHSLHSCAPLLLILFSLPCLLPFPACFLRVSPTFSLPLMMILSLGL